MPTSAEPRFSSPVDALRRTGRTVIAAQAASQVVSLAVLAVLYRQLGVSPYGLMGMVIPVVALARIIIASGLDVVTIQQTELSDEQVSALFWVNQALGVAAASLMGLGAPLVAWFFDAPELTSLTLAMAGTLIVFVVGTQHQALLQRRLRLGALAMLRLGALALGGLAATVVAVGGGEIWALVAQQYVELVALAGLAWWAEPWRPGWTIRGTGGRRLVGFGGHYMISSLASYVVANVDKILVGRVLGKVPLALYSQAFGLAMKPVHVLNTPLAGVMLPALSRAVADRRQYADLVLGFFRFILLVMLPTGVGLAIVAPETMRVLGGPDWAPAGPILAVLALAMPLQSCHGALSWVFASAGQARRLSLASVLSAGVVCGGFSLGLYLGLLSGEPVLGVALGYTAGLAIVLPPYLVFALRGVGVPCREWLVQLHPAAPATVAMGLVVIAARWLLGRLLQLPDLPLLAGEVILGVASYAFFARRAIRGFLHEAIRDLG